MTLAIVLGVLIALRLMRKGKPAPIRVRPSAEALFVRALLAITAVVGLRLLGMTRTGGYLAAALAVPLFLLIATPRVLLHLIVIPGRLPRLAYWIRLVIFPIACAGEASSAAIVYAALAAARNVETGSVLPWLRSMLSKRKVGGHCGIVAVGLVSALSGSRAQARALLVIADSKRGVPRSMRSIARDWLVADSARAGEWRNVVRLGRRGRRSLRWSYVMARLAERMLGDPQCCRDWQLWSLFLIAPRRRATWPLLRRALSTLPPAALGPPRDFAHALGELAQPRNLTAVRLSTILEQLEVRLADLDANGAQEVAESLRSHLIALLEPLVERDPELARAESAIMSQVIVKRRTALFADIEARCREYAERRTARDSLDSILEWQIWALLRDTAERLMILDPGVTQILFVTVYVRVCNFAVYQVNIQKNAPLAEDMFSWLYRYARPGGDEERNLARNIRATGGKARR